jgi:hypothetical protein
METLDKHFRTLTKASFARYGFTYADVLMRWPEIVGTNLAAHCRPEKISWPRGAGEEDQKRGGTLVLKADPGRALDLQHETPHIIERINRFFGYGAISTVKIKQAAGLFRPREPDKRPAPPNISDKLSGIADDRLRETLGRLGGHVLQGSPQGK